MSMRTCMLALSLLISLATAAQDKIYKKDGSVISVSALLVRSQSITYKRADNPTGPEYTILKAEVAKMVYKDGSEEVVGKRDRRSPFHDKKEDAPEGGDKYGRNIFSVIPGAFTADIDGTMADPGLGICYERSLDERGHLAFTLPVMINFLSDRDFTSNNNYLYAPVATPVSAAGYTSLMFMPGIKFYPRASDRVVRYSLGLSAYTMFGKQPYYAYDYTSSSAIDRNYSVYGFMFCNSLNVAATQHLMMSIDVNTGAAIFDDRRARNSTVDDIFIASPSIQFLLKVGYRF